jgi:SAM-dependent methyltransferase
MSERRRTSGTPFTAAGFTAAEQEEIARVAEREGWRTAAHDYMRRFNYGAYRLAVDDHRAQLRFLLPVDSDSRVLDLGCGWGGVALNLATCAGSVVAVDGNSSALRFVSARRKESSLDRLHSVQATADFSLPFADDVFDAVVLLSGPAEAQRSGKAAREAERSVLEEARRVLRMGGHLLWGVSNRLGLSATPYQSRRQLRTCRGYIQCVREVGFSEIQCHAALPSHQEPYFVLPIGRPSLVNYLIDSVFNGEEYESKLEARGLGGPYKAARALWPLARALKLGTLVPRLFPSYLMVAH